MQRGLSSVRLRPYRVYREVPVCLGDDWGIVKGECPSARESAGQRLGAQWEGCRNGPDEYVRIFDWP
jgi:hypothetical protein